MKLIDAFELMRSMGFYDDCAYCDCDKLECEYDRIYTKRDICDFVESHIFNAPTIDAEPVRYGHWIENDNGTYSCSECHSWIPNEQHYYARYCLYCGAKMDKEEEDERAD